jgi:hypothetical protein
MARHLIATQRAHDIEELARLAATTVGMQPTDRDRLAYHVREIRRGASPCSTPTRSPC